MSNRKLAFLVGIGLLIMIVVIAAFTIFFVRIFFPPVGITPTPLPHTATTPQPTSISPTERTYTGPILHISPQPVQFKNAIAVIIQGSSSQIPLYISHSTTLYSATGQPIAINQLQPNLVVSAKGTPVNGGVDVSTLRVQ